MLSDGIQNSIKRLRFLLFYPNHVCHLTGNVAGVQHMFGLARQALRVDRRVLAQPQQVRRLGRAALRQALHRRIGGRIVDVAEPVDLERHSTTLTIGCAVSAR